MSYSELIKTVIAKSVGFVVFMFIGATSVYAQPTDSISLGNTAVTGFSGTLDQANDQTLYDNNGPSVRILTLPGSGPFGLRNTLKPFTATPSDVGQVFGITFDNAPRPNIFVAATSAYGLAIYKPNVGRLKHGAPGAQFMPGQFGPVNQGGGSSSIWRIDGTSGKVTLFANVVYNGIENMPAALGGLAFDPITNQLFVADRTTGMIHRFSPDGTDKGVFDHGVQGLTAIGQQPAPFDASTLANINTASFDTENPQTWGFAPAPRRVFALAVHGQRLYYSIYGPKIWSVGIAADGSFVNDARFEVDSPALQQDIEISSIVFDGSGFMYIAERGAPTGDYNFINVANSGQNRVKRFAPKLPSNSSPAFWAAPGGEYAIGMPPDYQNADGGVALTCGRIIWATGDHLLDTGSSENAPHIDGLQGNDKELLKPANMPPQQSWFVNYYDYQADPDSRGHMGAIVIRTVCSGYMVPAVPTGFNCPVGTFLVDGLCLIPPSCPVGTIFQDGYCIYPNCPWGFVRINNVCVSPPRFCDYGTVFINGYCVPVGCPEPLERATYGYCHCPDNLFYQDGRCMPPLPCPPDQRYRDGRCMPPTPCPPDQTYRDGRCMPPTPCPPYQTYRDGRCVPPTPCPPNQIYRDGHCVPPTPCPTNQTYRDGRCVPPAPCPINQTYRDGRCVPPAPCPLNQTYRDGHCVPPAPCPINQAYRNGHCVPQSACPTNQTYRNGHCVPQSACPTNQIYRDGHCVPTHGSKICPRGQILKNGRCAAGTQSKPTCSANRVYRGGRCVPIRGTQNSTPNKKPSRHIQPNHLRKPSNQIKPNHHIQPNHLRKPSYHKKPSHHIQPNHLRRPSNQIKPSHHVQPNHLRGPSHQRF